MILTLMIITINTNTDNNTGNNHKNDNNNDNNKLQTIANESFTGEQNVALLFPVYRQHCLQ